jgi:CheY-like chemotaxis protein
VSCSSSKTIRRPEATSYLIEAAFGCQVLVASSCVEALALIDAGRRVDLIFSDVVLPGKDGLTLARLARERLPDVQVALATGWTDEIEPIFDRGYLALLKPYSVQRLEAVFTELLCKSPGTTEVGEESAAGVPSSPASSRLDGCAGGNTP